MGEKHFTEYPDDSVIRALRERAIWLENDTEWRRAGQGCHEAADLMEEMVAAMETMVGKCFRCFATGALQVKSGGGPCEASCPDCREMRILILKAKGGQGGGDRIEASDAEAAP